MLLTFLGRDGPIQRCPSPFVEMDHMPDTIQPLTSLPRIAMLDSLHGRAATLPTTRWLDVSLTIVGFMLAGH